MKKLMLAAVLAIAPLSNTATADVQSTIEYRQAVYAVIGKQMGLLSGMNRGKIEYDQSSAKLAADTIAQLSLIAPHTFSADSVGIEGTKALASYNTDGEDFAEAMARLQDTSAVLAQTLGDSAEFPKQDFINMARSCGGCHDQFKAD